MKKKLMEKKIERTRIWNRILFLQKMNMVSKYGAVLLPANHYLPEWVNCNSCCLYDFNKNGCKFIIDRTNSIVIGCAVPKNVKIHMHWFCLKHKFKNE